jgi:hypothetical protein
MARASPAFGSSRPASGLLPGFYAGNPPIELPCMWVVAGDLPSDARPSTQYLDKARTFEASEGLLRASSLGISQAMKINPSSLTRSASLNDVAKPTGAGEASQPARMPARSASLPAQLAPLPDKAGSRRADPASTRPVVAFAQSGSSALAHRPSWPLPPVPGGVNRAGSADRTAHASGRPSMHADAGAFAGAGGRDAQRAPGGDRADSAAHRRADVAGYMPAAGEASGASLGLAAGLAPASSAALNTASGAVWAAGGAASFVTDADKRPASLASKLGNTAAGVADAAAAHFGNTTAALASGGLWASSAALNLGTAAYDTYKGHGPTAANVMKGASAALNGAAAGLSIASTRLAGVPTVATATSLASSATWLMGAGVQAAAQYAGNRPRPTDLEMGPVSHRPPAGPDAVPGLQPPPAAHRADDVEPPPMPGAFV